VQSISKKKELARKIESCNSLSNLNNKQTRAIIFDIMGNGKKNIIHKLVQDKMDEDRDKSEEVKDHSSKERVRIQKANEEIYDVVLQKNVLKNLIQQSKIGSSSDS